MQIHTCIILYQVINKYQHPPTSHQLRPVRAQKPLLVEGWFHQSGQSICLKVHPIYQEQWMMNASRGLAQNS